MNRVEATGYVTIRGQQYIGWRVIYLTKWEREHIEDGHVLISDSEVAFLAESDTFIDKSFVPNYGDEIYVGPNCSLALADIRKNYKVKRKVDEGVCNVYTHRRINSYYGIRRVINQTLIDEDLKIIVCGAEYDFGFEENMFRSAILQTVPEIDANKVMNSEVIYDEWVIYSIKLPELYTKILTGDVKKPIIDVRKLPLKRENALTLEQLDLVLRVGQEHWSETARENMLVQLSALNQYNWRDYPGTMSVFFQGIFVPRINTRWDVGGIVYKSSRLPKACRELIQQSMSEYQPFASDEDVKMAISVLEKYLGTKIPEFVSFKSLLTTCEKKTIPMDAILHCFQNTIRLRPKTVSNNA